QRGHRRIHAATQRADRAAFPHLAANSLDSSGDEGRAAPVGLRATDAENKVPQDFRAAVGVLHFRMKLHRVDFALRVFGCGDGVVGLPGDAEARGQCQDVIAMAVPDLQLTRETAEQLGTILELEFRAAVFAPLRAPHLASQDRKSTRLNSSHGSISYAVF